MKKCSKIICMLLVMVAILSTTMVFAEGESGAYNILANVLNALLSALAWFGYAIAIGALVFMGIKYVMSGANEKANLKGSASKYLIGVALIVFCSTIAAAAANIANTTGENTNTGIVDKGIEISGIKIGDKNLTDAERKEYQEMIEKLEQVKNQTWNTKGFKFDHIIVHTPVGVDAICDDGVGSDPVFSADTVYHNGKEFKYWLVKRVETSTLDSSIYKETDKDFLALGSDRFWDIAGPSDYTYEAGIKKWKIKVNGQDIRQSEVFDKTLTVNTVKNEDIKSNMIVPGAKFYVDIEIDYSEVDVPFIVEYNTKNVDEQFTDFKMLRLYNNQR